MTEYKMKGKPMSYMAWKKNKGEKEKATMSKGNTNLVLPSSTLDFYTDAPSAFTSFSSSVIQSSIIFWRSDRPSSS